MIVTKLEPGVIYKTREGKEVSYSTLENPVIARAISGATLVRFNDWRSRYITGPVEHLGKLGRAKGQLYHEEGGDLVLTKDFVAEEVKLEPVQLDLFN